MLRVIGPRVLLKPIEATPRSSLVALTDKAWSFAAEVIGIGTQYCQECGSGRLTGLEVGDVVYIPATAGQEVTMHGEIYWIVRLDEIGGVFVAPEVSHG